MSKKTDRKIYGDTIKRGHEGGAKAGASNDGPNKLVGSGSFGSVDHERHQIKSGIWDLIYTDDGWELENQHSYTCYRLDGITHKSSRVDAMRAARKLSREIEGRFSPNAEMCNSDPSK